MTPDHLFGIIIGAFPVLGAAIWFMARYIVKIHKEGNERAERMITAMTNSTDAIDKMANANKDLAKEISGLNTNTLLQTEVLRQIKRKG